MCDVKAEIAIKVLQELSNVASKNGTSEGQEIKKERIFRRVYAFRVDEIWTGSVADHYAVKTNKDAGSKTTFRIRMISNK